MVCELAILTELTHDFVGVWSLPSSTLSHTLLVHMIGVRRITDTRYTIVTLIGTLARGTTADTAAPIHSH
jgi:hypothetical protein